MCGSPHSDVHIRTHDVQAISRPSLGRAVKSTFPSGNRVLFSNVGGDQETK